MKIESVRDEPKKNFFEKYVTEAAIIAALPVLSYLYAFLFEMGYFLHFGAPPELIQVSAIQILTALLALLASIGAAYIFVGPVLLFIPNVESYDPVNFRIKILLPFMIPVLALWVIYAAVFNERWIIPVTATGVLLILIALVFLSPFLSYRKLGLSYKEKLQKIDNNPTKDNSLDSAIFRKFKHVIGAFIGLGILGAICFCWGDSLALQQDTFFVLKAKPYKVVLGLFGNDLVVASFDKNSHRVFGEFEVIDKVGVEIVNRKLGRLRAADK